MTKFIISILLIFTSNIYAQNIEWAIQITDPEFDLKHIPLTQEELKPILPKTSWRCRVGEVLKKGEVESRELHCDYSIEKAGTFTTFAGCSSTNQYDESKVVLFDERKDLTFTLLLLCRRTEDKKEEVQNTAPANP